jgi:hypothetical protein
LTSRVGGLLAGLLAALFGAGCLPSAPSAGGCAPSVSDSVRLTVQPRQDNALVLDAAVELREAAPVYVEYGSPQTGWLRTATSEAATRHSLPLIRLRPETAYQARAFALDRSGCPALAATTEATSGPLPRDLKRFSVQTASGTTSFPLAMMDWRAAGGGSGPRDAWLVILAGDQIVWYYPVNPEAVRAAEGRGENASIRLRNGNFLQELRDFGVEEITPDARSVAVVDLKKHKIHHDLVQVADGRIMFIGAENRVIDDRCNGGPPDFLVRGDTLSVLDLQSRSVERLWSAFDALDPCIRAPEWKGQKDDNAEDWTHINTISFGSRGNVLLSVRRLSQILSLTPDLKRIEWRLGGPGGDFAFPDPSDRFYGQHTVYEVAENRLLMLDNGSFRPAAEGGEYSRALELELDLATKTARKVWEFRPGVDIYADRVSSALRLANGNTLVNFGFRARDNPGDPIVAYDARPDGSAGWEQTVSLPGQRVSRYRVYGLETIGGEQPVEPTALAKR